MQGIFINGARPKSKKAVREALTNAPETVRFEATSFHGGDYDGPAEGLPASAAVHFVGPDPSTKRNFYGTASHAGGKWVVK